MSNGRTLQVSLVGSTLFIADVEIVETNHLIANGVLHVLSSPLPAAELSASTTPSLDMVALLAVALACMAR